MLAIETGPVAANDSKPTWRERRDEDQPLKPWAIEDLIFFFCHYESSAGLKATHIEQLGGGGGSAERNDESAVALLDSGATKRANRIRRALERMGDRDVVVLYRLYGPRNASAEGACFKALAPIADMTPAVDDAREEMALVSGEKRETAVDANFAVSHARRARMLERDFWRAARTIAGLDRRIAEAEEGEGPRRRIEILGDADAFGPVTSGHQKSLDRLARDVKGIHELQAQRDAWQTVLGTALTHFEDAMAGRETSRLGATLSALCSADREITHADAIRAKLAPFPESKETPPEDKRALKAWTAARKVERQAWDGARKAWVAEVVSQAMAIRKVASAAFLLAVRDKGTRDPIPVAPLKFVMMRSEPSSQCAACAADALRKGCANPEAVRHHGAHAIREVQ